MGPDPRPINRQELEQTARYLILITRKPKVECLAIMVRPFHSPDPNSHNPSPTQEVQLEFSRFCQAGQQPKNQ